MKRNICLVLAVLACAFVSCQRAPIEENNNTDLAVAVQPLVFQASITNDGTKTSIAIEDGQGKVSWVKDDQITVTRVSDSATAVYKADTGGTNNTTFTYVSGEVFSDDSVEYSATYGNIDNQTYSAAGANCPMSAPATTGKTFSFTESAAMLKLNVKADGVSVTELRSVGKVLTCSPAVTLNTETGTDFYIALPPGTYNQLSFTLVASDGKKCTKSMNKPITLKANCIQPVTLSSALVFSAPAARAITYYDKNGAAHNSPEEFTATSTTSTTDFKISFSNGTSNAIDFAAGDVLEAKIKYKVSNYACCFGVEDFTSTPYSAMAWYTNGDNNWWRIEDANTYVNVLHEDFFGAPLIFRISEADGIEFFSSSESTYKEFIAADNEYLSHILDLGTTSPLFFGLYNMKDASATFEYLSVSRGAVSVSGISLNISDKTLDAGNNFTITPTITPVDATNTNVRWATSNAGVATVSSLGVVTAVAAGNAIITAITEDGEYAASCNVTVNPPVAVTGVTLDQSALYITVGNSDKTLVASIEPSNAANKNVSWESSNTSVATVSSSGEVHAVSEGDAVITVTTEDGGKTAQCTVHISPVNEVILWKDLNTNTTTIDSKSLTIIASGVPSDSQICFADGDYIELKLSKKEIAASDKDLFFMGNINKDHNPQICFIGHNNKYTQVYYNPSGWTSAKSHLQELDIPYYYRFGCTADGTKGSGSYSTDGVNWSNFENIDNAESVWASISNPANTPLIIQSARTVGNLQLSTYHYVKIVRKGAVVE